mmetsp:Transcript_77733/g.237852  ORF Transcript_77733/g.237852 Transcript_77733/m.237852 type:complete len:334 (+) Transcript_77733:1051-2052(+)
MSFELVATARVHGVVPRIVRSGRDLVQKHRTVPRHEELHAEDSRGVVQGRDGHRRDLPDLLLDGHGAARRAHGRVADRVLRRELHHGVGPGLARTAPHHHHRHLALIITPLLGVALGRTEALERLAHPVRRAHHRVALAVVGVLARLQHEGVAERVACTPRGLLVRGVDEGPKGDAVGLEVPLLHQLVLDEADARRRGLDLDALLLQLLQRAAVDVLDLHGEHVRPRGQLADLRRVLEGALHRLPRHLPRGRLHPRRVQGQQPDAQAVGGLGHHPAQLAAAEHTQRAAVDAGVAVLAALARHGDPGRSSRVTAPRGCSSGREDGRKGSPGGPR